MTDEEWDAYWASLSPEDRKLELEMMDLHVEQQERLEEPDTE
jgi:hypothetical protein